MGSSTFWPTLWATATGAGVGVVGIGGVFLLESKERYESKLSDAMTKVCYEIQKCFPVPDPISVEELAKDKMLIGMSLQVASMVARGKDVSTIRTMSDACFNSLHDTTETHRKFIVDLMNLIYGWRSER